MPRSSTSPTPNATAIAAMTAPALTELVGKLDHEIRHLRRQVACHRRKTRYRLAQCPGSYIVLKYVRSVIKRRDTHVLSCPPAPIGVLDGSRADISLFAGISACAPPAYKSAGYG